MIDNCRYDSNLRLKAFMGDAKYQYDIASYYEKTDLEQALFWYKKSALQGNDKALEKCIHYNIDIYAPLIDREVIRKDLKCRLFPLGYLKKYKYTIICSYYKGKWILSSHKKRNTWETQGGHIEDGESPLDCALRELYEESGITDCELYFVCDYFGFNTQGCSNGVVYLAIVHSLGKMPKSEMKEIAMFEKLPSNLTYPYTSPIMYTEALNLFNNIEKSAMAIVLYKNHILTTKEIIYGKEVLSCPKGHQEKGETLLETAIRECYEETNILLTKENLVKELDSYSYKYITPNNESKRKTIFPYLFKVLDEGYPLSKEEKIISVNWLSIDEFLKQCSYENVVKLIKEIF